MAQADRDERERETEEGIAERVGEPGGVRHRAQCRYAGATARHHENRLGPAVAGLRAWLGALRPAVKSAHVVCPAGLS